MKFRHHVTQAVQITSSPSYANGIRAAIATVGPIVIGSALGWHFAAWMGLAGFNVALSDKGGPMRPRFFALLSSTIYGALGAIAGAYAGVDATASIILVTVWSLAAGLARVWGGVATTTGIVSLATLIVSLATPAPQLIPALQRGGAVLAGSAFAMLLALVVWRVRPYRPARRAVARAYAALAAGDDARRAIDEARMALASLRRGMNAETPRGERLLVLVESADRLLEMTPQPREVIEWIARVVESERNEPPPSMPPGAPQVLEIAVTAAVELNKDGDSTARFELRRYVDPIAGALRWESVALRHALRVAIAAAIAQAVASSLHLNRGYWMTLSTIIILQPYTSATLQKGLQRVAGTIGGAFVAALLIAVIHDPVGMTLVIFAGAAITVAMLPVNYGLYSLGVTPTFVLLAELGTVDRSLVLLRVSNTMLGAAIALFAAFLFWPASERGRVREDLVAALRALADYADCIGECDDAHATQARRTALLGMANADASLQRLLGDEQTEDTQALMALLVYARRFGLSVSALAAQSENRLRLGPAMRVPARVIGGIATAIEHHREPDPLPDGELPNQLIELHRAAARLA